MELVQNAKLHNRFDIEVRNAKTGELKQEAYAENIILNQAWAQILSAVDWFDRIYYGTGTGAISATRTALFTPLSNKVAISPVYSGDIAQNQYNLRQSITMLENEHVGSILSEVGIGTATVLCTHAMLKDMNGNQVAITKTAVDIITIYATVYVKPNTTWGVDSVIDFVRRPASENSLICSLLGRRYAAEDWGSHVIGGNRPVSWTYVLGAFSGDIVPPTGTYEYLSAPTVMTLDVANKKATFYTRISAASANIGGLRSCVLMGYYSWTYSVTRYLYVPSIISKMRASNVTQSTIIEQIGTGNGVLTDFTTSFPFIKTGAVIKVDGTVVSPTVIIGVPNVKDIKKYMYTLGTTGIGEYPISTLYPYGTNSENLILENPFYANYGIDSIAATNITLYTSDDMVTWTQVYTGSGTYTVAAEYKQKRYWKATKAATTSWNITAINVNAFDVLKNVVFATAPAVGAVITVEYDTDVAAKDINHVLDVTVVIQLGEYTP